MIFNNNIKAILAALFGCLCIGIYFWLASSSRITGLLHPEVPRSEIISDAQQNYNSSDFVYYDMRRTVELNVDKNLLRYAQMHLKDREKEKLLPIGEWEVTWKGETETKEEGTRDVTFSLRYDFDGNLIGMVQDAPEFTTPPNFDEVEAPIEARKFLRELDVETDDIELRNQVVNKDDRVLRYDFVYARPSPISPDLEERYHVQISGQNVTEYRARVVINRDKFEFPSTERTVEVGAKVMLLALWALLSLFLIAIFIKRLRQDVLEFRRAAWLGVAAFLMMLTYVAFTRWPEWVRVLAGGGGAGLFVGLAIMIVYTATESLNREFWPGRLALTDVLFKGIFRVREFGAAILSSLFLSGSFLFLIGGLYWLATRLEVGYLAFDDEAFWIFAGNSAIVPHLFKNILISLFVSLVLFSFCLSYLKSKIQNRTVLLILFGLIINIAGFNFHYLHASYFGFFLFLPIALLSAYCVLRFDFIAILLATFLIHFFLEISLISLLPDGLLSPPGLVGLSLVAVLLLTGSFFVHSENSLKDFDKYIPSYVGRIAQRERFLKELEIAHSVQERFLPQSVPSLPNMDIAGICRPATEVGGDYYDFIYEEDRYLGVVIGDVSGKGVAAAFYMTMVKGIIKTLTKTTVTPKEMLTKMNTIFYENTPNNVFVSMVYGLFDLKEKTLTFARAGHNPVIFRTNAAKTPESLNPKGLAIGLEKGNIFSQTIEEISMSLTAGDTFLFFTDGISESVNTNGDEFGEERLRQIVNLNGECSAQTLVAKITSEVDLFAGKASQHDDLTMVVVRIGGEAS